MSSKRRMGNSGFSFVEILCAIAILSLISGTIATIVTVSTRTYRSGVSETSVQQEAQLAANNIGDIIKDACEVIYYDGDNGKKYENGEEVGAYSGTNNILSIVTNDKKQYDIQYLGSVKDESGAVISETNKLIYQSSTAGSTGTESSSYQLLAGNISSFSADTTNFADTRTVSLNITVTDSTTGKEIPMTYTMTSRNEAVDKLEYNPVSDQPVIIFLEDTVCLVPGESEYDIPIAVTGNYKGSLTAVTDEGLLANATLDYVTVKIPIKYGTNGEVSYKSSYNLTVSTTQKDSEGKPLDTKSTTIYCRYADNVNVTYATNLANVKDGTKEGEGAVYTFYANVTGGNLSKFPGRAWDVNYKTGQAVYWKYDLKVNGTEHYTYISSGTGEVYSNKSGAEKYIKIISSDENIDKPYLKIKLTQTMLDDFELTVTAISKHAQGINKADSAYDKFDSNPRVQGSVTVKPRGTKITGEYEITLAPNETGKVELDGMVGATAIDSSVTFDYNGRTDSTTVATYNNKVVTITLGNDETGSGKDGTTPYTFTIDVKVKGEKKNTITVYVSRIDTIKLTQAKETEYDSGYTYDFKVRFNTEKANDQPDPVVRYNKDDLESIANVLAVDMSWVVKDASGTEDVTASEGVHATVTAEVQCAVVNDSSTWKLDDSKDNNLGTITTVVEGKIKINGAEFTREQFKTSSYMTGNGYNIVRFKPAIVRVYVDSDGKKLGCSMIQCPQLDIKLNDTSSSNGVGEGKMFVIKAQAKHPYAAYNKGNKTYNKNVDDITKILVIKGESQYLVVEPGQGYGKWSSSEYVVRGSENEFTLPFTMPSSVTSVSASLSGNKKTGTKIAILKEYSWSSDNLSNPFIKSASSGEWGIDLFIDEAETGTNGSMTLTLDGYDADGNKVTTSTLTLKVRRVNNVSLTANGNINTLNKVGSTVTLTAKPTGYGSGGVEYYRIQRDSSGNVKSWESNYKSPYTMKWEYISAGGVHVSLEDLAKNGYIEIVDSGTYPDNDDTGEHEATVTFKILQQLPNGRLRATSLHSLGSVSDIKYNKSGLIYSSTDEGVYGELLINGIVALDGFRRGNDSFAFPTPTWESIKDTQMTVYRYCRTDENGIPVDKNGNAVTLGADGNYYISGTTTKADVWYGYYKTVEGSNAKKFNANETFFFLPEYSYIVEMVHLSYNNNSQELQYPYSSILASALNFGKAWSSDKAEMDATEYTETYFIDKVSLLQAEYSGTEAFNYTTVGSAYQYNGGYAYLGGMTFDKLVTEHFDSQYKYILEYNADPSKSSKWTTLSACTIENGKVVQKTYDSSDGVVQKFAIKRNGTDVGIELNVDGNDFSKCKKGYYRVRIAMDESNFKIPTYASEGIKTVSEISSSNSISYMVFDQEFYFVIK